MGLKEIATNPPERQHPKGTQRYILGFRSSILSYSGEESPTCAPSYTHGIPTLNEIQSAGPGPEVLLGLEASTVQMCH